MDPVIIIGMHRSGTSMVCRALESAGLFTGANKEHNSEAVFFLTLNQWILEQHGAGWDCVYNMRFTNDDLAGYIHRVTTNILSGPVAASYTGSDDVALLPVTPLRPWGWKDPRNTFTAPVWSKHFPDARIIHVCRNPVDVAASLRRREQETMQHHRRLLEQTPADQVDGSMRFQQSARLFHIDEGICLWQDYVAQSLLLEQQFAGKAMRVRYEDFLADPCDELERLAGFCGLTPTDRQLQLATAGIDASRRLAFMQDDELQATWRDLQDNELVRTLGYDSLYEECRESAA